jgi:transcription elongation factor Elf1
MSYATALMAPVDVYYEWIDACEAIAKDQAAANPVDSNPAARRAVPSAGARAGLAPGEKMTDEDANFIDDEGVEDAEAEYEIEE